MQDYGQGNGPSKTAPVLTKKNYNITTTTTTKFKKK
jgi:hypothetical protein